MENKVIISNIQITSPDKILIKDPRVTKKDLAIYYEKVSLRMLPFIKKRIISSVRCPDGVSAKCFYKKHLEAKSKGINQINIASSSGKKEDYYYITDVKGVISEVQMNTIEFHIWGSTVSSIDTPNMIVFDLDPDEKVKLSSVRKAATDLKSILDSLKLKSFLKVSGSKGYHIVIPLSIKTNWESVRTFSKNIALLMSEKWPEKYTASSSKLLRKNKIFIDWMRNIKGATSISPYSVRAKNGARVSMPIAWSELGLIKPDQITMNEAIKRLNKKDPWQGFDKVKQGI